MLLQPGVLGEDQTLVPAIVFALTMRRRVVSPDREPGRLTMALTGVASLALWFTVAAAGRWIGFS